MIAIRQEGFKFNVEIHADMERDKMKSGVRRLRIAAVLLTATAAFTAVMWQMCGAYPIKPYATCMTLVVGVVATIRAVLGASGPGER